MRQALLFAGLVLTAALIPKVARAADDPPVTIQVYNEFIRCDQTGTPVAIDAKTPALANSLDLTKPIPVARGGYASVHVIVRGVGAGYKLTAIPAPLNGPAGADGRGAENIAADLFTEWYHTLKAKDKPDLVIPDGLVPYKGEPFAIPHPDMKVAGQTAQAFWVDIWVPEKAPAVASLQIGLIRVNLPPETVTITLAVADALIPKEDAVYADHNCYGLGFVATSVQPWPAEVSKDHPWRYSPEYFGVIHAHHRLAFEHRSTFHQLGTNHVGGWSPEFGPATSGEARTLKIDSWELFDKHYGPLLDGSAMKGCRRAETYTARPIPYVYTTITPEWPAPFVHWGTPAYEYEFTKIVRAMHDHFAEKGWKSTNFELFFNHKMRYKGFPWDGDETRFDSDDPFFVEYARLLKKSLPMPEAAPEKLRDAFVSTEGVRFVFRSDSSWNIGHQVGALKGVVNFWVMSGGCISFWPEQFAEAKARGDIVWFYGGTPSIQSASGSIVDMPARAYLVGYEGYVRWLTTANGGDPWNASDGAGELLYYPGGLRGFHEPLPCIRLKLERNALQDVALIKAVEGKAGGHAAFAKKALALANLTPDCFWKPDSPLKKKPVIEWNNPDIGENCAHGLGENKDLDVGAWWLQVRALCLETAK